MKILLVNPPNSGKSIPEEKYGIDSIKQIFRGEPLALEVLAGNLYDFEVRIVDLKAAPDSLPQVLAEFKPDIAGITGVTCEANSVLEIANEIKESCGSKIVVGGIHASNDPNFFNRSQVDYVAIGLGKASFRELVLALNEGQKDIRIPGIAATSPGAPLAYTPRKFSSSDLADEIPPAYHLVDQYRSTYYLASLHLDMGFVVTAFGCPFNCSFCCISGLTGGRYLTHKTDTVIRDIKMLGDLPVIRLLDANTFGDPEHARRLCTAIREAGIKKQFLADVRSDTVVKHPDLMQQWKDAGLRAVIIGFEEISDEGLKKMNKSNLASINTESISILHEIGITIIGDFIVSPDYDENDFNRLGKYIKDTAIDLPMITVMTPLPGTKMHREIQHEIIINDLDYYTLTNAVVPTRLDEKVFYQHYASLLREGHTGAKL
ncbi:MAG: B12-binding domain-containing radical SAM protein [Proteobacteria bacterium]|nr:B12-binding domain-containing radical SAM protein [Pseudomonadota bacterium]MBU1715698.1 B12-binding domain-containing radical SAM protein [Pseudomonadota bacterium]